MRGWERGSMQGGGGAPCGLSFERWRFGEPNNHNQQEHCAELQLQDAHWNDCFCEAYKDWICQIAKGPSP
ncbi:hypothetical protein CRUP_020040 [Coryphaenoides rupestris]|nr:hypothetical protein CRUP_020040 [Coryphaenoides rupestris]